MGVNPDEFYHQQKRVQQDHERASHNPAHGTIETWQIEQESADEGTFTRDPMDGQPAGFFARLIRRLTGKK
jgi:hypothetical protein